MPRKRHLISTDNPYHVTSRANNQEWFQLSMDEVWEIFSNHLYLVRHAFNLRIHAFVLMSNHFHLMVSTPDGNLSQAMQYFIGETSREICRREKRTNHIFKQRYFRSMLCDQQAVLSVYKYIYQNPLRAGLSKKAHHYKYSTLVQILGIHHGMIPINDDIFFEYGDWHKTLSWINELSDKKVNDSIKKGLKRAEFKLAVDRQTRKIPHIDLLNLRGAATAYPPTPQGL